MRGKEREQESETKKVERDRWIRETEIKRKWIRERRQSIAKEMFLKKVATVSRCRRAS